VFRVHGPRERVLKMAHNHLTPEQIAARVRRPIPPPAPRPAPPRPEGRGNELWQKLYKVAQDAGHPNPEKMADTGLRAREKSLALLAARPKLLVTKETPKPSETVMDAAAKKGRMVPHAAFRCNAQTLEGRQCGFKATCGNFCKKHTPV